MENFINVLGLCLLGSVVALSGGVVFLYCKKCSRWLTHYSVPFASGVLLTVALLGLLPEAVHMMGEAAFGVALLAFLGAYGFENFACDLHHHHECDKRGVEYKKTIPLVIVGDTIHNFIDGVAIAAAYLVNPGLGLITAISTLLHEVPHEIGDFGILLKAGWKRNRVLLVNLVSALGTVVGGLGLLWVTQDQGVIGTLLAVSAGMFLYLGASDFLPHANEGLSHKKALVALLVGVVAMWGTLKVVPHSHENGGEHHDGEHEELVGDEKMGNGEEKG